MLKYLFLLIAVGTIICINIWYYVGYYDKINIREKDVPERIVVSLTTSPKRISKIQPVIECIEKQTIKPKYICLNLPRVYKRDNTTFQEPLPDFIVNNPFVYVNWCEDIGPATKVIPTAQVERDPDTLILSIDDDTYYPPMLIETFLQFSRWYPDAVITGTSFMSTSHDGTYVQLLEGFSGVLYKQRYLSRVDLHFLKERSCYLGDDFFLSNEILKQNVPIVRIGRQIEAIRKIKQLDYGFQMDALHLTNKGNNDNYKACAKILDRHGQLYITYYKDQNVIVEQMILLLVLIALYLLLRMVCR